MLRLFFNGIYEITAAAGLCFPQSASHFAFCGCILTSDVDCNATFFNQPIISYIISAASLFLVDIFFKFSFKLCSNNYFMVTRLFSPSDG